MFIKDWKKEILTIPNILSLFRLLLIPVYVTIFLNAREQSDYYIAAGILAVSCLTDLIDGKIARHFNMISTLGKILDPLADKATQFTLILCLALKHPVLWYLVPDCAGGLRMRKGKMLKGALLSGKICTTVLFLSLIIMVMFPTLSTANITAITIVDIIFMAISLANYMFTYFSRENKFQSLNEPDNT